jgi:hypothetical protein
MEKEIVKSQNRTKITVAIIGLIGVLAGTFGMDYYTKHYTEIILPESSIAYAEQHDGVYIFFRSRPIDNTYTKLGDIDGNTIFRAIEDTQGKKGFKNLFNSVAKSLGSNSSFEKRLEQVIAGAKEQYGGVEGLIFSKDLTKGEAIKF